jgi:RNA polymerase sigma factor (sigma-70 family)
LQECRKENLNAYNTLFDRYSSKLFNYPLKYVKDEQVAEEAMMDLMLWVWEKRHKIRLQGDFSPYIFRAMKNVTIKAIRKKAMVSEPFELF